MSVTCVAWVCSFGLNPQWQDSNLWAERWAILLIARNITLANDRFDSWIRALHTGMPFGWVYEATGHMLRVFHHPPPSPTVAEALKSTRGGISIKFIDGQEIQTGAIRSLKILIHCCSTLFEEEIQTISLFFNDFELLVFNLFLGKIENPPRTKVMSYMCNYIFLRHTAPT